MFNLGSDLVIFVGRKIGAKIIIHSSFSFYSTLVYGLSKRMSIYSSMKVNGSSYNVLETLLFRTQNSFKLTLENA